MEDLFDYLLAFERMSEPARTSGLAPLTQCNPRRVLSHSCWSTWLQALGPHKRSCGSDMWCRWRVERGGIAIPSCAYAMTLLTQPAAD